MNLKLLPGILMSTSFLLALPLAGASRVKAPMNTITCKDVTKGSIKSVKINLDSNKAVLDIEDWDPSDLEHKVNSDKFRKLTEGKALEYEISHDDNACFQFAVQFRSSVFADTLGQEHVLVYATTLLEDYCGNAGEPELSLMSCKLSHTPATPDAPIVAK